MVGLAGLPALRSGYARVQPAPPQADGFLMCLQSTPRSNGLASLAFFSHTKPEIKKAILG
jgi:hypothetical protein